MPIDWQLVIALLFVSGASLYLALKVKAFFQQVRSGKGCGSSCGASSCSVNTSSKQTEQNSVTVELQMLSSAEPDKNN